MGIWEHDKSSGSTGDGQNKGGKWLVTLASSGSSGSEEFVEVQETARCAKLNRLSGVAVASFTFLTSSGIVTLFNIDYIRSKLYG